MSDTDLFGGYGDPTYGSRNTREAQDLLLDENDRATNELSEKVAILKDYTKDIHAHVKDDNTFLKGLSESMFDTNNMLGGAMKKVEDLLGSGSQSHICLMVAFIVGVFLFLYVLLKFF